MRGLRGEVAERATHGDNNLVQQFLGCATARSFLQECFVDRRELLTEKDAVVAQTRCRAAGITKRVGPRLPVEKIGTAMTWSRARFRTSAETTSTKRG